MCPQQQPHIPARCGLSILISSRAPCALRVQLYVILIVGLWLHVTAATTTPYSLVGIYLVYDYVISDSCISCQLSRLSCNLYAVPTPRTSFNYVIWLRFMLSVSGSQVTDMVSENGTQEMHARGLSPVAAYACYTVQSNATV